MRTGTSSAFAARARTFKQPAKPDGAGETGALPGLIAIIVARRMGIRTMWIDSVANAEEFSMAGRMARRHADRLLSQWPAVAEASGAEYAGSVL